MGEKTYKRAEGRVKLLKAAIENIINYGVREKDLLEEVLGKRGSKKFEKYKYAFTNNELCFLSIVLDRSVIPHAPFDPLMLYRYRHYGMKLIGKPDDKLALVALEHLMMGLSRKLNTVETLITKDLDTLGIDGEYTIRDDGTVSLWVHAHNGLTAKCGEPNFNQSLPFNVQTSLEQIYQAAQFRKLMSC